MSERDKDHCGVAVAVAAALPGRIAELLHFVLGQPLAPVELIAGVLILIRSARCGNATTVPVSELGRSLDCPSNPLIASCHPRRLSRK
jgi:hypothetical protein